MEIKNNNSIDENHRELDESISIGTVTLSINTPDCLGHSLLWPNREEIVDKIIHDIINEINTQYSDAINAEIIRVEPGSIKILLIITLAVGVGLALRNGVNINVNVNVNNDDRTSETTTINISNSDDLGFLGENVSNKINDVKNNLYNNHYRINQYLFRKHGLWYGPVKETDNILDIIHKMNPKGVNSDQAMVALLKYNSHSFVEGNINNLRVNSFLSLPKSPKYLSKAEAKKLVEEHNTIWAQKKT